MEIPVLIEPVAGNGFRARSAEPLGITAEGATSEEALQKVRQEIQNRLAAGTRLVSVEVPSDHARARFAGIYSDDDPLVQEWLEIMAENRRRADEDPNY
jgi:predicted RNase H-like HicB family nuclease